MRRKAYLLALAEVDFSNVQISDGGADKYATVIVDKNRYSVPSSYVGFKIKVLDPCGSGGAFYKRQEDSHA